MARMQSRKAPDGHPEFLSHLLMCLCKDFPFRPALIAGLVPFQVNLWMGAAPEGGPQSASPRSFRCALAACHMRHLACIVCLKGLKTSCCLLLVRL